MNHLSLFSGFGGFDLAAQWMGWNNIAHCEIDPFCRKLLNYYWPNAHSHDDITKTNFTNYRGGGLISLLVDFLASRTVLRANVKVPPTPATYGPTCLERYEKYDRATSWGKTFAGLLVGMTGWYSSRCVLTWKTKVTKYNRFYFQLAASTPRIKGTGFSLLPTPVVMDTNETADLLKLDARRLKAKLNNRNGNGFGATLGELAQRALLPTPRASQNENRQTSLTPSQKAGKHGLSLAALAGEGLLPTPTATSDPKGGCTRTDPKRQNDTLACAIHGKVGTPGETSLLNPRFVAEMMGFPPNWTELPFQNGGGKA